VDEIREYIGSDSLKYLSMEQLKKAVDVPQNYCYACFDGNYPVI